MAESLINQLGKGKYEAVSAGSFPTGYVHPESTEMLKRNGIGVGEPRSKSWGEYAGESFDDALHMLKGRIENELL